MTTLSFPRLSQAIRSSDLNDAAEKIAEFTGLKILYIDQLSNTVCLQSRRQLTQTTQEIDVLFHLFYDEELQGYHVLYGQQYAGFRKSFIVQ
jgi:hypothetical protein